MFTRLKMNRHIMKFGKSIADKEQHPIPTALINAKQFLDNEYLKVMNISRLFSVQAIRGIFC